MMSSNETIAKEEQWLRTVILPQMLKSGKLFADYSEKDADTFKIRNIEIKFIGAEEAFMLTICYRSSIELEFKGTTGKRALVVKKTPALPEEVFTAINFGGLFSNEIVTYEKIMPVVEKFAQKHFNVPPFYYGELKKCAAIVILEDFSLKGFRVTKDKTDLSLEHVLVAVKYLANFHGINFALKQVQPELFYSITADLKECRYANPDEYPQWKLSQETGLKRILKATRQYEPTVREEFLLLLERLLSEHFRYGKQRIAPQEPMVTLCHGDYLRNNVAYKYSGEGTHERPVDILMFDLQTMGLSSPMKDLTIFLGLSAFERVRHKHFSEIFDTYCNELEATFKQYALVDLPEHLNKTSLLKEYIRFLPYSIFIGGSFLMTLVEPEDINSQQLFNQQLTDEELIANVMQRGGEVVDREMAHQIKELFDLSVKHKVDVCEGFNWV